MNTTETLAYLEQLQESRMRLDLRPSVELLKLLGDPDRKLRSVIVAGTNGKGSTCAYLTSIARCAGLKVGTYTSPHLESVFERIAINGSPISVDLFAEVATDLRIVLEAQPLHKTTYFEFLTMMAVLAYAKEKVDLAIFEVGLGGRLDTTNALERVGVVLSRIGFDHVSILGKTLTQIAKEKAAIMRANAFAVVSQQPLEAQKVFEETAQQIGIHPKYFDHDFKVSGDWNRFSFQSPEMSFGPIRLGLKGNHQMMNAATAVQAAMELGKMELPFTPEVIVKGISQAALPGRLEKWTRKDGKEVWLDVAHNEDSMKALVQFFIQQDLAPTDVLIGMLKDKDWRMVLELLKPISKTVSFCKPNSPRAWELSHEPPSRAFDKAIATSPRLLCTGSFYVAGEIRTALKQLNFNLTKDS